MEDDRATVETTVSADAHPDNSEVGSKLDVRKIARNFLRKQAGMQPWILLVAGLVLLVAVHRGLASRALPSSISSILQKSGRLLKRGQERDDWGLCSLEDFEHALPPSLKEGKKSLAALASQLSGGPGKDLAQPYQLALAQALSNGSSENLVGMTISLQNLQPLDRSSTEAPLPKQDLLVTGVLGYYRWSLVVNTVDVETKKEFSVSIPIVSNSDVDKYDDNGLEQQVRVAAEEEKGALLQVCGSIPAKSAASQKGMAVPYYTGQILGLDSIHTAGYFKIFNTVSVMGKVVGDISSVVSMAEGLEPNMKDYIAQRLLQIVLKLERSGVGHMQLGWRSLFLREDGSFVLGNFCSCAPFGEEKSRLSGLVQLIQEPSVLTRFVDSKRLVPDAKANLWNLGVLLFQLYTGTEHPYAEVVGPGWRSDPSAAAFQLLRMEIRSEMLIPQLERSKVPLRWGGLILRLLEPQSVNRITAFQLVQEFPDLIGPQSVAND